MLFWAEFSTLNWAELACTAMDKLNLTGLTLGRVFNYRSGRASAQKSTCTSSKQLKLKLKTQPKSVLGYPPLTFASWHLLELKT